jgi:hypothetical protein
MQKLGKSSDFGKEFLIGCLTGLADSFNSLFESADKETENFFISAHLVFDSVHAACVLDAS